MKQKSRWCCVNFGPNKFSAASQSKVIIKTMFYNCYVSTGYRMFIKIILYIMCPFVNVWAKSFDMYNTTLPDTTMQYTDLIFFYKLNLVYSSWRMTRLHGASLIHTPDIAYTLMCNLVCDCLRLKDHVLYDYILKKC